MAQLLTRCVDIKFAVSMSYKETLSNHGLGLIETRRICDKYFDTQGLDLLNVGAFLRERNDVLELKEPVNWQGSYLGYNGATEFSVSRGLQAKEIVEKKFKIGLDKMIVTCSVEFDREHWSCVNYDVVIDRVMNDDVPGYIIGELKLKGPVEDPMSNSVERAENYLKELGFKRALDGKVVTSLRESNYNARLKLIEMT